ncbi:hypothetical protein [Streptomyces murinus]|uniref:hypothetical protein n=1 Tax=Streptomyces murinus TaxID=33900 RepID=UPI003F46A30E
MLAFAGEGFSGRGPRPQSPASDPQQGSTITRNVRGIDGTLDAVTNASGGTVLQLTGLQGDAMVQLPLDTAKAPLALSFDEYGNPECGAAATRYGWLGGEQRSSDTVTGAILYRRRYCVGIWVAYAHPKTPNIYRYKHGFCR